MIRKLLFFTGLLTVLVFSLAASDLDETLEELSADAGAAYVNPMVSAFGSDMNSGWFHKVPEAVKSKWNFEVGLVAMGSLFADDKTFAITGSVRFNREQAEELTQNVILPTEQKEALINAIMNRNFDLNVSGPTIIGEEYNEDTGENSIEVSFTGQDINYLYNGNNYTQEIPAMTVPLEVGGLLKDLPALPLAAPQLTIGTIYGTSAAFRYLPDMETVPEIGKVSYMGYGIQHNPAVWFGKEMPVDIAAAFYTQTLKVGSIMESSSTLYGINVAKTFGAKLVYVTPYLGLSSESANMKFNYDYQTGSTTPEVPESINVNFEVEGKNTARFTAGVSFRLAILNFNFDYSFAKYPAATAGVMLNFSW